jgi:hypothetical protein
VAGLPVEVPPAEVLPVAVLQVAPVQPVAVLPVAAQRVAVPERVAAQRVVPAVMRELSVAVLPRRVLPVLALLSAVLAVPRLVGASPSVAVLRSLAARQPALLWSTLPERLPVLRSWTHRWSDR